MSRMTVPSSPGTPAPAAPIGTRATSRIPLFTADAWAPLKTELFRSLWIATSIAQIGTWMREAAGPTLMENLTHSWPNRAEMVTRVLMFSNLPICLFSVFAGALADVLDRRRLLIVTQVWMVIVSFLLGLLTFLGHITPAGLLALTFLLGTGTAAFGPALQAVLPELVPKEHFALAINMNSIALNVARALGPALFILVVTLIPGNPGAGISFMLAGASFLAATWVLFSWKRAPQRAALAGEQMWDAIRAGFRYTVYSPANRAILLRVATFIIPALVIWSLVPIIATNQLGYLAQSELERQRISALLFAFMGIGAIFGVFLMPGLHGRYKIDPVVNVCTFLFGSGLVILSFVHSLALAAIIFVFLGINWVIIPTNFNTATQKSVPAWVKGRAISFYLTVLFGSFAVGALLWGKFTHAHGIHATLLTGGIVMLACLILAKWFPLTVNEGKDLSPGHKEIPPDRLGLEPAGGGPIQIGFRYRVPQESFHTFKHLMHELRLVRLRNGARHWRWHHSDASGEHLEVSETMVFSSWRQYTRSFNRATQWDVMRENAAREFHVATEPPVVAMRDGRAVGAGFNRDWVEDRVADALDRAIDEVFVAYDRLSGTRKPKLTPRRINVQFSVITSDNGDVKEH